VFVTRAAEDNEDHDARTDVVIRGQDSVHGSNIERRRSATILQAAFVWAVWSDGQGALIQQEISYTRHLGMTVMEPFASLGGYLDCFQ
jgi:hypothetical protein